MFQGLKNSTKTMRVWYWLDVWARLYLESNGNSASEWKTSQGRPQSRSESTGCTISVTTIPVYG